MQTIRKSEERGQVDLGWLQSQHSFSFGGYYDPNHMGFGVLRVINDDHIQAGQGFGAHPHRDMEIITYMVEGQLQHRDSLGNGSVLKAGDVQRMTAGSGIRHSEFNASSSEDLHLLQIWIEPERNNLPPSYQEQHFSADQKRDQWRLLAAPHADNALHIHQDLQLYASQIGSQQKLNYDLVKDRQAWLQVVSGELQANGIALHRGDGLAITDESSLQLKTSENQAAEVLLFDMPRAQA